MAEPQHRWPRHLISLSPCNVLADGRDESFYFSPAKISISIIITVPPQGSRSLVPASSCQDPERGQAASHRDRTSILVPWLSGALGIPVTLSLALSKPVPKQGQNTSGPNWTIFGQASLLWVGDGVLGRGLWGWGHPLSMTIAPPSLPLSAPSQERWFPTPFTLFPTSP